MTRRTLVASTLLAAAGSILYAAAVVHESLGFLAFVATAPWLLLLTSRELTFRAATAFFLTSVYAMGLLALPWLRSFNTVAWFVAPLFYVPLFFPIVVVIRALRAVVPRLPLSVTWALAFTAGEYLRIRLSAGEIPFAQLGASLISFDRLIQTVDIAGVWGLTFFAAFVAAHIVDCLTFVASNRHDLVGRQQLLRVTLTVAVAAGGAIAYGEYRDRPATFAEGPRVLLVQPNFPTWDLTPTVARARLDLLVELTHGHRGGREDVDLIVWPENSVVPSPPYDRLGHGIGQVSRLRSIAAEVGAAIVVDGPTYPSPSRAHHTASFVEMSGRTSVYHKNLLVPWSEFVPYSDFLRGIHPRFAESFVAFVRAHNPHLRNFDAGTEQTLFRLNPQTSSESVFVAPICYETLSATYMRACAERARERGDRRFFIVNPVNEKLLGNEVHGKTLSFCRFRAIENRATVLRSANNGISAAIDPNGHVYAVVRGADGASVDRAGTIVAPIIFDRRFGTIYSRWGDWLPIACLIACVGACIGFTLRRVRTPRVNRRRSLGEGQ